MALSAEQFEQYLADFLANTDKSAELKRRLGLGAEIGQEKGRNKVLLDDYTFRRLDKFTGAEGTWQEWSFNMLMTVAQVDPTLGQGLEELKKDVKPLTDDMFISGSSLAGFEYLDLDMCTNFGPALFGVMCSLTGGEANAIVRGVSVNGGHRCGFRAFYALNLRYNPKTPARMLRFLTQVVNPAQVKNIRELPLAIEKWEAKRAMLKSEFDEEPSLKLQTAI